MNKLHLSPKAQDDLREIKDYIRTDLQNSSAALAVVSKITADIRMLRTFANAGTPLSSIVNIETDYRFFVSGNYMSFYRIYEGEVYVDRVLYARSDYLRVLLGDRDEN